MKKLIIPIAISFFCLSTGFAASKVFQQVHRGEYNKSSQTIHQLAAKKNKEAQYYLAIMYFNGYSVRRDVNKSLDLMKKSASKNFVPAQIFLGRYYYYTKKDIKLAAKWFLKAAKKGNENAQLFTITVYANGYGVKKNLDKAQWSLFRASLRGNAMAQYELGKYFLSSRYSKNRKLGKAWLKKSAAQGYKPAVNAVNTGLANKKNTPSQEKNESAATVWQLVDHQLRLAGFTLSEITSVPMVSTQKQVSSPKLSELARSSIIKADYSMIDPKMVPVTHIAQYALRENYFRQKAELFLPEQPFNLPAGYTDNKSAFSEIKRRVKFGNPRELFYLAQMYDKGIGTDKDPAKAFSYYKKSADQHYIKAEYEVGLAYLRGVAVPVNTMTAIKWLSKAALKGSARAQFVLGNIYEYGFNQKGEQGYIPKNLSQAQAMYSLAAHHGVPMAQYRLAQLYASGLLNPSNNYSVKRHNQKIAFELYQSSDQKGIKRSATGLAYYYAEKNRTQSDYKKSFELANSMASKSMSADLLLAILYDRGIGVSKDLGDAIDTYEKLAEKGNPIAQFMLGTYSYLKHDNTDDSVVWLEKSAAQNFPYAQYNLAILLKNGKYVSHNETFQSLLIKAAKNNLPQANLLLADHALMNPDRTVNVRRAIAIYTKLAIKQNSAAQLKLGYMNQHGISLVANNKLAVKWYSLASKNGNPKAQYLLANMYQSGGGVSQNLPQALKLYKQSAGEGYLPAINAVGYIYQSYLHDNVNAVKWYLKSAHAGSAYGQYNLGLMYLYGIGIKADPKIAFDWIEKSAILGHAFAETKVGDLYFNGVGVNQNMKLAQRWYQKAAQKNSPRALYQLALMLESGVNGDVDRQKAATYYQRSAEQGNISALLALARLNQDPKAYYQKASALGSVYADYQLSQLSDSSKVKFQPNPNYCVRPAQITSKSFFTKIGDLFSSLPDKEYMVALNDLNHGNIIVGTSLLKKILKEHPDFEPAKRSLSNYLCRS